MKVSLAQNPRRRTRFSVAAGILGAAAVLAPAASATWSIVAVNTRTGEVCIASATCLDGLPLQGLTPVLRVGLGGACAQSLGDSSGVNRNRIWSDLMAGMTPTDILADLAAHDSHHQQRQYGIVDMADDPVTFSGNLDGMAYYGVASIQDDIRYAIQGNVLTGIQVVTNAENAFLATDGDLGQKVIAGMEAARLYGGDGRCSCNKSAPMGCGCPPPQFDFSAYTGFFVLARIGDVDGATCDGQTGCANGQYFCDIVAISGPSGPEPVLAIESAYATWRAGLAGIPDQIRTRVTPAAQRIPADGVMQIPVDVELRDIEGVPVTNNPSTLSIVDVSPGAPVATVGPVQTISPGHFQFPLTSTGQTGEGRWQITVQHSSGNVLLWPELVVQADPPTEFFSGFSHLSASHGAHVPLYVDSGAGAAGQSYLILASLSGTSPGTPYGNVTIPLNFDPLFRKSLTWAGVGRFAGTAGTLDSNGRGVGTFSAGRNLLYPIIGRHMDWAAVVNGQSGHATNPDGFDIVP